MLIVTSLHNFNVVVVVVVVVVVKQVLLHKMKFMRQLKPILAT